MRKYLACIILTVMLLMPFLQAPIAHASDSEISRYTVLVLDTSADTGFYYNGVLFYTADAALDHVKIAAKKFNEDILRADGKNYLAIVSFNGEDATVVSDFTTDIEALNEDIDNLSAANDTRSVAAGLQKASDLINAIEDENAIKNVVLFTTGMTNAGTYNYEGRYDDTYLGSNWVSIYTNIHLHAYSNSAFAIAEELKQTATLYTIGLFQPYEDMPSNGTDIVKFFKVFAKDCASSSKHFYEVDDPNDLEFIFGEVAGALKDSDGDGLPDHWERKGVTVEGEFIDLPAMGADPSVPDVFVEIDWMVESGSSILGFEIRKDLSLAPSENAIKMVYEAFRDHGIQLHIDAGPDSVDFVTGKQWGELSGGNTIPYEKIFTVETDQYAHWNDVANTHFSLARRNVFKYCLFVNRYDNGTSSGRADNIPGQYFLVANSWDLRIMGDDAVAGTFMHELGHTLGLSHGGFTDTGENDHTKYKPNYLSVMNYLFQMSGLVGTNELNYSEYDLPDLDENALDEQAGIDPDGLTADTGLGTKFIRKNMGDQWKHKVLPIAKKSVNFNGNLIIDKDRVTVNINGYEPETEEEVLEILTSSKDWDYIDFQGGDIGGEYAYLAGVEYPGAAVEETLQEATLEELLEAGVLGNEGAGALENAGAVTFFAGASGQHFYVRVINPSPYDTTYHLSVESDLLRAPFSMNVSVPGSEKEISYVDVPVPIVDKPTEGDYEITACLSYDGRDDVIKTFDVTVYKPTEDEKEELRKALEDSDDLLPKNIIDEYLGILADEKHNPFVDVFETDYYYDPVLWAVDEGITNGMDATHFVPEGTCTRAQIVTFLWRANGSPVPTSGNNPFTDVAAGQWYTDAVLWAVEKGITTGTSATTFSPDDGCTRGQVATFLWRSEGEPTSGGENIFTDITPGAYYYDAVLWAVENGITNGMGDGTFAPDATCTRGQIVTFLYRAMN